MSSRLIALALAGLLSIVSSPSGQVPARATSAPVAAPVAPDAAMGGTVAVPEVYRSVRDFGLRADGFTNEGAALNRAIAELSGTGGGHLVVPDGVTVFAGPVRILLRHNVLLEGGGPRSGIRWGGSGLERGIQVMGSNAGVRNLTLTGAARAGGLQQFAVWMDGGVRNLAFERNRFRSWHVAFVVRDLGGKTPKDFTIAHNRVNPPVRWNNPRQVQVVSMINYSPIARIERFRVDANTLLGAPNGGIFIDGGRTFSISDNRIVSTAGPGLGGSMIGVYTEFGGNTTHGTVARNTVFGNGREVAGIELNAGLDQVRVIDNQIFRARDGISFYPGIEGDRYPRSHLVTIARNRVYRPLGVGFLLDGAADQVTYDHNLVVEPGGHGFYLNVHAPDTFGAGVVLLELVRNVVISRRTSTGYWFGDSLRVRFQANTVCHQRGGRAPSVGLQIGHRVNRLEGEANLLEGRDAALRNQGSRGSRVGKIDYAPAGACPAFGVD